MKKLFAILILCGCAGSRTVVPGVPNESSAGLSAHGAKFYRLSSGAGAMGITAGPDGALWFTEYDASKFGRITTSGKLKIYATLTANETPWGITIGPKKTLWFAESNAHKIARITTSGHITEFNVQHAPTNITEGPDHALWFIEQDGTTIYVARMTTTGRFKEYRVPAKDGFTNNYITTGPDKALWFTLEESNKVGRITTSGNMALFRNHDGDDRPTSIVAIGGSLWVGESAGLANVSAAGHFTEYPLTNPGAVMAVTSAQGSPWYGVSELSEIGTVSGGKTVVYPAGAQGAQIWGITEGRDRALWFTETSQIGRFVP